MNIRDTGARLKAFRENRKLTMRELASASNVSVSLVSKIESGKVSPTVMSLNKLLEAMNVDLYEFFLDKIDSDPSEQVVFRQAEMVSVEDDEHKWYFAFAKHPDIKAELTYEEYQPHTKLAEKESHKGDLLGMVISGELTLEVIGKGKFIVRAGDAFYVKAGQLHVARNEYDEILKIMAVQLR
ncbi:MAG: helix-turn-helix domain-containing protein [Armatimonadota bacterium]